MKEKARTIINNDQICVICYVTITSLRIFLTTSKEITIIPSMSYKNTSSQKVSLNDLPDLLTIREVASLLRVSSLTIKRWGKKGKLPAIRINSRGDRRYKKAIVLKLLGENLSDAE